MTDWPLFLLLFDEAGNADKQNLIGFNLSDDGRVPFPVAHWLGERLCVIVDRVVVVVSFLDLLNKVGGVVFCLDEVVEL